MASMADQAGFMPVGEKPAPMRVDPYAISTRVTVKRADGVDCTIDRSGVSIKQNIDQNGALPAMALPAKAFKGIAVRVLPFEDGSNTVVVELHHENPELCVPVLIAEDIDDVAADWHSWSRIMRLPMLVIRADNIAEPVRKHLGQVMIEDPILRRKRITSPKRRPWFLKLREKGAVGPVERISAAEIIARA